MTDTQLDPELELEAQQLANYEDELRELAEEVKAQDEDFEANKDLYEEAMKHIDEETAKEVAQYQEWNRKGEILKEYNIDMFRYGEPWTDKEDDALSIVECIEYGGILTDFHVSVNKYGGGDFMLFIHLRHFNGFNFDAQKIVGDYEEGINQLNKIMPLVINIAKGSI